MSANAQILTSEQKIALEIVYDVFHDHAEWPTYSYVDRRLRQRGTPSTEALIALPLEVARFDRQNVRAGHIQLTLAGLTHVSRAEDDVELFVRAIRWMARREAAYEPASPTDYEQINLTSTEFVHEGDLHVDHLQLVRLLALLRVEPVTRGSAGPQEDEPFWQVTVDDTIRPFASVKSASDYLRVRPQAVGVVNQGGVPRLANERGPEGQEEQLADQASPDPDLVDDLSEDASTMLSSRTIARLSRPFEGGNGPTHGAIDRIWLSEDASSYLTEVGNKAERVRAGLRALRDGARRANGEPLPPDPAKLSRVAEELATTLVSAGLVSEEDVLDALDATSQPVNADEMRRSTGGAPRSSPNATVLSTAPIFLVHGHDHGLLHQVVRVVERATSREVIVLHEQANRGQTVLEKFEQHAQAASFAVVLLTSDDIGGPNDQDIKPRARQNVIFELGFFFGRLGRDRVCVLLEDGVEQPSDTAGLVYVAADPLGGWKYGLARELQAAGLEVAFDRIP